MKPKEIIAIAIREAFRCGKEEGEAYQRMWSNMNENFEKAEKGEPGTERDEVTLQVQSVPGNRIGSEPDEHIAALEKQVKELGRICEEKDAKITDYHKEIDCLTAILKERDAEIAKLRLMVPEVKPSEVYTEEPNKEAYRIKVDPPTDTDPGEAVAPEHLCKDCRHSNETGPSSLYCCLKESLLEESAYACSSFSSKIHG